MKPKVYVETTILSYLTAWRSNDVLLAAHQEITARWWSSRAQFELYVSEFVVDEIRRGDPDAASERIAVAEGIERLLAVEDVESLAQRLLEQAALPAKARIDAAHIAIAAVHGMDYLLTWNCKHIANAFMRPSIERICRESGYEPPVICTPEELQGEEDS